MKIQPQEIELVGAWLVENGEIRSDVICARIHELTSHHLQKIATSKQWGAWETLFQDPDDGRYWEQTYPQGEMHGGAPMLRCISKEQAKAKYGDEIDKG